MLAGWRGPQGDSSGNPITLLAPKEETSGRRVQPAFYLRDGAVPLLVEKLS